VLAAVHIPRGAVPSGGMSQFRPTATSRVLLTLVFCLALLAPAGASRVAGGGDPAAAPAASPLAGFEQGLLRDRVGGPVAAPGKRDDRERPGPALLGVLGAVLVAVPVLAGAVRGRAGRAARRRGAAAAGPRAPPSLQPAPI
jgi:hypothetical protein